jgi:YgiT-type zinc finger domain-containing protein
MRCLICKHGESTLGSATVTAQCRACTIVVKAVPADVCGNCGEYYLSEDAARRIARMADEAERSGTEVAVRRYAA